MKIKSQNRLNGKGHQGANLSRRLIQSLALFAILLFAPVVSAEVQDIVVGITPTCPYGISACWAGAHEALSRLDGVASVDKSPDFNTSTAHIRLKSTGLPNPDKLRAQFESLVGKAYIFRGVEVTVEGPLKDENGGVSLQLPESKESLRLAPLDPKLKLQWNFKKQRAHGVETEERVAYQHLIDKNKQAKMAALKEVAAPPTVQVTGPLKMTDKGPVLEVREFSLPKATSSPRQQD